MTQEDLAGVLATSVETISRWERGAVVPGIHSKRAIEELLTGVKWQPPRRAARAA